MFKSLKWKYKYAKYFSKQIGSSFIFGWRCAEAWEESYGILDYEPEEAADEELTYWTN